MTWCAGPASTWSLSPATLTWKNSSSPSAKMAMNFTRSSRGTELSSARSKRRSPKSSQESSRFENRSAPNSSRSRTCVGPRRCLDVGQDVDVWWLDGPDQLLFLSGFFHGCFFDHRLSVLAVGGNTWARSSFWDRAGWLSFFGAGAWAVCDFRRDVGHRSPLCGGIAVHSGIWDFGGGHLVVRLHRKVRLSGAARR